MENTGKGLRHSKQLIFHQIWKIGGLYASLRESKMTLTCTGTYIGQSHFTLSSLRNQNISYLKIFTNGGIS